jgi:hypothetical protein
MRCINGTVADGPIWDTVAHPTSFARELDIFQGDRDGRDFGCVPS